MHACDEPDAREIGRLKSGLSQQPLGEGAAVSRRLYADRAY